MPKLLVDNKEIEVKEGTTLLKACLDNGIYVPNLCYLESIDDPPASCRMCFVEIEGEENPITSCTVTVEEDMVVKTDTLSVRRLQQAALRLLLSVHHVDCKNCQANKKCELQNLAKFLKVGLKSKHLEIQLKDPEIHQDHPCLDYYPNRCVLCGKCIRVCREKHGQSDLTFAKRGFDTVISSYRKNDASTVDCEKCIVCVDICPVGALILRESQEGSIT
jgi:NADH dehydrogenase/NADH:ubiquinone oxidoreductase subunit G